MNINIHGDTHTQNQLVRSMQYRAAVIESKAAASGYEAAQYALELARSRERNAELASQAFEHVGKGALFQKWGELTDREREIGISFARYSAYGRTD